jgi:hypothetical protein
MQIWRLSEGQVKGLTVTGVAPPQHLGHSYRKTEYEVGLASSRHVDLQLPRMIDLIVDTSDATVHLAQAIPNCPAVGSTAGD